MHRIAGIIAALVAGPSIALAQPPPGEYPDYDDGSWFERKRDVDLYPRDYYPERDPYEGWHGQYRYPERWDPLAGYANARDGSTFVRVPPRTRMTRVRIEGAHGAPVVTMIEIHYARFTSRATVNRRLLRGESVDIPLDPRRRVRAIVVHTDPRYRGGYSVWGG